MDDEPIAETADPEDAFSVLADETRIDIVLALWEADADALSFSELREAVGVADSGQFNYHLGKLTGQFVTKGEDGYALSAAGIRVVGAVLGGAYTMEGSTEPITLPEPCPRCGGELTYSYEDEFARLDCQDGPMVVMFPVPPATFVGADPEEMPERTERYLRSLLEQLRNHVCPYCDGEMLPTLALEEPPEGSGSFESVPLVEYDCERCSGDLVTDLASPLLAHPAVVSFFYDRGIDVRGPPFWEFTAFDEDHTMVNSRDPLRASVTFEADGDELTVTLDESMSVVDVAGPGS
jgi:hypothetical protein